MDRRKEFFNGIAERWDRLKSPPVYKLERVVEEAMIEKGNVVCDVGTGTGVLIPYLLKKVGKTGKIYAIDYAENMIKKVKEKKFPQNVIPMVEDIHHTSFPPNFFDRIIANACFPHFKNKVKALKEIYRILKPNGILIISHPDGRKWVNSHHRKVHPSVKKDVVPSISVFKKLCERINFTLLKGIDEEYFFLLSFRK